MYHKGEVLPREEIFVIAVDADLTMLDTLTPWLAHFGLTLKDVPPPEHEVCRDLVPWIEQNAKKNNWEFPLDWWKNPKNYENVGSIPNCMEFLKDLASIVESLTSKTVQFIVVSSCFPEHESAKWKRIDELYPDIFSAKISTSSKHFVDFDLIIDDSVGVALNCLQAGKMVIMPTTGLGSIHANNHPNLVRLLQPYPNSFFVDYRSLCDVIKTQLES